MQVSRHAIFVFVEGTSDRNIYDRLCRDVCDKTNIQCEIRPAQELPSTTGGKPAAIDFFVFLRKRGLLLQNFKGKTIGTLFFLDKDIDDLLKRKKRSPHVTYTEYYEFENYAYVHGDIIAEGSAAADLDESSVRASIPANFEWRRLAALEWMDWVKLCITAQLVGASCTVNYGRPSQVNTPLINGNVIQSDVDKHLEDIRVAAGLSKDQIEEQYVRAAKIVDDLYKKGRFDIIFKGKWYKYFLADRLQIIAGGRHFNKNGLEDRITIMLKRNLDLQGSWSIRYRSALQYIIDQVSA